MSKANTTMRKAREARERAALKAAGGDRVLASIRHHEERLARAVDAKDHSTMRDATKVLADLRRLRPNA